MPGLVSNHLVKSADMTTFTISGPMPSMFSGMVGVQFIWTGTPTGTFGVSVSNNHDPHFPSSGTFTPLTLDPVPGSTGSAGSYAVALRIQPFLYYKLTYSGTGAGTLDAYVSGYTL